MFYDKIFFYSLILSCCVHGALIFFPQHLSLFVKKTIPYREVRVNYYILDQKVKQEPKITVLKEVTKKQEEVKEVKPQEEKSQITIKKISEKEEKIKDQKKVIAENIILPDLPPNFPNRPQYLNYYQIVRERIKLCAYRNYIGDSTGEVFIRFTLASNGQLKANQVIDERSQAGNFLKQIALKSIRDAAPYPAFPKEIIHSELKFNTIISFELKK